MSRNIVPAVCSCSGSLGYIALLTASFSTFGFSLAAFNTYSCCFQPFFSVMLILSVSLFVLWALPVLDILLCRTFRANILTSINPITSAINTKPHFLQCSSLFRRLLSLFRSANPTSGFPILCRSGFAVYTYPS